MSHGALIRRMLGLAWRYRLGCLRVLSQQVLLMLVTVAGLGLMGLGIDVVRYWSDPANAPLPGYPLGWTPPPAWSGKVLVAVIAGSVLALGMLRFLLGYSTAISVGKLIHLGIVVDLRAEVYDKLQRLSFRFFDRNDSGSIINRVTADANMVGNFINGVVIQTINLVVAMAISLFYMIKLHPTLTLACMATTPGLWLMTARFARKVKPAYRESRRLTDRLILALSEHLRGVHVVKGFARQEQEKAKFDQASRAVKDQRHWIFWRVSLYQPAVVLLTQANLVIVMVFGGWLVIHGQLALGSGLIVFTGLLQQFSSQVATLANVTNTIQVSLTGAQRVFEIIDAPLEIDSKPNAVRLPKAEGRVRFENVSFGYKPEEPVLHNISLEVPAGSVCAVVGATGAGKSTLMSLLPRFYDPTEGSVYVDGVNVRDLDLDDLRRNIGLVFQESFLFSNTVAANIAFGHPEATREQIERAARIAAAHDFIMELPKGYDTVIGEKGGDLSGGQRQRLAIARAVLLEPSILILDDATAAIDPQTEHEILQAMESAMKGRTTFVVAHRLSTLRRADQVVVLEKGRIVQIGTHDQLMSTRGHYRRAAKLQTADAESKRILGIAGRRSA